MSKENCGGPVVKDFNGEYFLRDDAASVKVDLTKPEILLLQECLSDCKDKLSTNLLKKLATASDNKAYSLFQDKPYQCLACYSGSLEWATEAASQLIERLKESKHEK